MTDGDHFTISNTDKPKVKEAFDKWKHRKLSKSKKICEAIIKLHAEEEKGSRLDSFTKETRPLDLFPKVTEEWTPEKLQQYNILDVQRVVRELYKRREEIGNYLDQLAKLR